MFFRPKNLLASVGFGLSWWFDKPMAVINFVSKRAFLVITESEMVEALGILRVQKFSLFVDFSLTFLFGSLSLMAIFLSVVDVFNT